MTRAICIRFDGDRLTAAVIRRRSARIVVEGQATIPLAEGDSEASRGQRLAEALAPYTPGRTPVTAAIPRSRLRWQNFDLPPAPADDLADLAHLQAQRDLLASDDDPFDFLPLDGGEDRPHRVLGVSLDRSSIESITSVCRAAGLNLTRITAVELGWPALLAAHLGPSATTGLLAAAVAEKQLIVWTAEENQLSLVRTAATPAGDARAALRTLPAELRRTALAFERDRQAGRELQVQSLVIGDRDAVSAAAEVAAADTQPFRTLDVTETFEVDSKAADDDAAVHTTLLAPLVGLAADEAAGRAPPIDLLHPRRRPQPPSRKRQLTLAAGAALSLAAALVWQFYQQAQAPLRAAEDAAAQEARLSALVAELVDDVQQHDRVADWLSETPNLLDAMTALSVRLRPQPLTTEDFPLEHDAVVTRITQANRSFTLTAAVRDAKAAGPVENRIRDDLHRVTREQLEAAEGGPAGYGQQFVARIERIATDAEAAEATP